MDGGNSGSCTVKSFGLAILNLLIHREIVSIHLNTNTKPHPNLSSPFKPSKVTPVVMLVTYVLVFRVEVHAPILDLKSIILMIFCDFIQVTQAHSAIVP